MHHIFNIPTLAPGVEYKLCQTCIPMSFLSLFSTQSIFIQFYGKCTHFVQLPECNFPIPLIYFKVHFFWIQVLLQQQFFMFCHVSTPCSYWTHLTRTIVAYVELEGQPHKPAEASHTGHNSWFPSCFRVFHYSCSLHLRTACRELGAEFLLCSDSAACIRAQGLLGRWWWPAEIPLFGPTWQDNLEAAQIHSRLTPRAHLGAGAS